MVKIKKATNIVPPKAAPLEKVIKNKKPKISKKSAVSGELPKPQKPLVLLSKPEKKEKLLNSNKMKEINKITVAAKKIGNEKNASQLELPKSTKTVSVKVNKLKKLNNLAATGKINKSEKVEKSNINKQKAEKKKQTKTQVKSSKTEGEPELANVHIKLTVSEGDLPAFNEEEFKSVVNINNIKTIANSLNLVVKKEVNTKKRALFKDFRYFLNVACFKIPNCPKRMVKLNLKHSLVHKEDDEVLVIVPDLKRGAKIDYEPTIEHYTDLFREKGIDELGYRLKIMPFNQLKKEHKTFEALRKLAASYDYFLCDGRIVGHAVGTVGKIFQKPRTTLHAVHFHKLDKLKECMEKGLRRTAYKQLHKGNLISIPVGNYAFSVDELAENVEYVVEQLKELYPGGWPNIRNMYMRIDITGTSALPLFVSNCQAPQTTPYLVGPKEKHMLKVKREVNAVLLKFDLEKTGKLKPLSRERAERKAKAIEYHKKMKAISEVKVVKNGDVKDGTEEDGTEPAKKPRLDLKDDQSNKNADKEQLEEDDNDDEDDGADDIDDDQNDDDNNDGEDDDDDGDDDDEDEDGDDDDDDDDDDEDDEEDDSD